MITHEKKIHELKKAFVKEQDKNIFFEIDLNRSRQKFREFLLLFMIANNKSVKFINFIVFIKNNNSMFKN